jgi:adenylyltransferase/sulfurtransferase
MILKEIGREGQRLLDQSCVAVVGLGALGSVSANLLARAGVGHLVVIDRDFLEINNLQRQVLYDEKDLSQNLPKAVIAARKLRDINSEIMIEEKVADVNPLSIHEVLDGVDLIVDGTDNFETRFLLNDYAISKQIPWIYGGAVRTEGMTYVVLPDDPPCLRCLFGEVPPHKDMQTCDQVGILAPVAHMVASFQATEAIKILAGKQAAVERKLWKVDVWHRHFKTISVSHLKANPCTGCRGGHLPYLDDEAPATRGVTLCGRNAVQIYQTVQQELNFKALASRLEHQAEVTFNEYLLNIRTPDPYEITVFKNGRAIIKGTEDMGRAKSLYAKYLGC